MTILCAFTTSRLLSRARHAIVVAAVIVIVAAVAAPLALGQEVPELQITSTNYIAIDAETGEIYRAG